MTRWMETVDLSLVWHDDALSLADKARYIAGQLNACALVDSDLEDLTDELMDAAREGDDEWFDSVWSGIYDWADDNRVWINIWGSS